MGEHTPGPWEWWTSCSWKRLTSKDERGHWMPEGNVLCPSIASDGHPVLSVSEEDMALIAAAPELLELAHQFKRAVEFYIRVEEREDPEGAALKRVTLGLINEVIAKAEGRS